MAVDLNTNKPQIELPKPQPPPPPPPPPPEPPKPAGFSGDSSFSDPKANAVNLNPQAPGADKTTAPPDMTADQKAAFDKLSDADKGKYNAVEASVVAHGNATDKQNLRAALAAGRLDGGTLDGLQRVSGDAGTANTSNANTTGNGYKGDSVLTQLTSDLGNPDALLQKGTDPNCGGMAAAYALIKTNPSLYVNTVTNLLEHGSASVGGLNLTAKTFQNGSSPTAQLFADSFIAATKGTSMSAALSSAGINAFQLSKLGSITGQNFGQLYMGKPGDTTNAKTAEQVLHDEAAAGKLTFANIKTPDGGNHWVVVNGVDGSGNVNYAALDGGNNHCSMKDFLGNLTSMAFDTAGAPGVAQIVGDPSSDDDGGHNQTATNGSNNATGGA